MMQLYERKTIAHFLAGCVLHDAVAMIPFVAAHDLHDGIPLFDVG